MHIVRRKQTRKNSTKASYLYLRQTFRDGRRDQREQTMYLAPEASPDYLVIADKALRRRGYTPKQREAILAAVHARVERNEHVPIAVRGKLVEWREESEGG